MAYTEICGKKLQRKLGAQLNEKASMGISKNSFAQKMMLKMGWEEGEGLGKEKQGMVEHIRVKQRVDDEGIGHEKIKVEQAGGCWWQNSMGDTLAKLAGNSNNKESKKKKKRKLEDDGKRKKDRKEKKRKKEIKRFYTDEELFVATGGARFGMRARRKQEGKWARAEVSLFLSSTNLFPIVINLLFIIECCMRK